jgi:subtilisin family serine protease
MRSEIKAPEDSYVPGELLVRFAPKARGIQHSTAEKNVVLSALGGGTIIRNYEIVPGLSLVKLPAGTTIKDALEKFNKTDGILYAHPNHFIKILSTVPNDSYFPLLWPLHNTGQNGCTPDADIDAPEAWDINTGSRDIIVAVIDTGVDYNHPDLAENMWVNLPEKTGEPNVDDDNNGYVDDIYGYDFYNFDSDPCDDNGHGTHCAGIIGAVGNNNEGVTGVCWNVKIMALKYSNMYGTGTTDRAIWAIEYSVKMGAKLSNNSWGWANYYNDPVHEIPALKDAINAAGEAGLLFVAAAGNDNNDIDVNPLYPASFDSPYIISVLATDCNDCKVDYSNYGPNSVDLGAPGGDSNVPILSTWPGNQYVYNYGTSMAAPYVAGACALVWSAYPSLGPLEVKGRILSAVDRKLCLEGRCVTGGRLNLYNALRAPLIEKVDINDGNCVGPGREITYTIDYNYPAGPNCRDLNDVNIIDYLPDDVDFNEASHDGNYNPISHTVIWNLGTLHPGDSGSVRLKVKVKCAQPGSDINNYCEVRSGGDVMRFAYEHTPVCFPPIFTKVDITGCVGPRYKITYNICYDTNRYGDTNVKITDYLPDEVNYVSSDPCGFYDPGPPRTVTWYIGDLTPTAYGCVNLVVQVNTTAEPNREIINTCELKGDCLDLYAEESTQRCPPTVIKEDDVPDGNCVSPGEGITYNICYDTYGYADPNLVIVDTLASEVSYVLSEPPGVPNGDFNTVTWNISTLPPETNSVTLTVVVKEGITLGTRITNKCEIKSGAQPYKTVFEYTYVCCRVVYVDVCATGYNNGTSWENAYNYLQDALKDANLTPGCEEIRVAEGNYWPNANSTYTNGSGDQTATFQLINGVTIKGGYAGFGEPNPDERNILEYETILSGDLAGNDPEEYEDPCYMLNDPCRQDNSYHVVTGSGVNNTAVLDGFVIASGNADGSYPHNAGGGMYNFNGSPTVRNCTFKWNYAGSYGGGMYNGYNSGPIVTNCAFIGNGAQYSGGGLSASGSNTRVTNCIFAGNLAQYSGGGICGYGGTVTNCILWDNEGGQISGDVNVTYSDVQDGWPGLGNINEDPMLDPNYHLTMCSPCIDAGNNEPNGGLPGTDIDGQPRIMDGRCIGEAIVDMGADEHYIEDCNDCLCAYCPRPASGSIAKFYIDALELSWEVGARATQHDVYFGTNYDEVNDANTGTTIIYRRPTTKPNYPLADLAPDYILTAGKTYYWRIDEVNDPCVWKGDVWNFIPGYIIVDDFSYYSQADLNAVWKTGYPAPDLPGEPEPGEYLVSGTVSPVGGQLRFDYDNRSEITVKTPWSEAKLDYNGVTSNWLAGGVFDACVIGINYDGAINNWVSATDPNYDRMYMALEDINGNFGLVSNPDLYAQVKQFGSLLQRWKVDLNDLTNPNDVNLADVNAFYLGFGLRNSWAGYGKTSASAGSVRFDNLRLYMPCVPEYGLFADLTEDYAVNLYDVNIMSEVWLMSNVIADIFPVCNPDGIVDLKDFALLANEWLTEQLGP